MLEISKACYLENVLFGKANSVERSEIGNFIETVGRMEGKELTEYVNEHMAMKMFLVSENVTAADVVVLSSMAPYFSKLTDFEKMALPHAFRWIDHVQHLPGMLEQVKAKSMFTTFPDESSEGPSKAQLKKLEKA